MDGRADEVMILSRFGEVEMEMESEFSEGKRERGKEVFSSPSLSSPSKFVFFLEFFFFLLKKGESNQKQ